MDDELKTTIPCDDCPHPSGCVSNGCGYEANDDMVDGYRDGLDLSAPEPLSNRSHSYRHGFANGRDDRRGEPRATAAALRRAADRAMELDRNTGAMERDNG